MGKLLCRLGFHKNMRTGDMSKSVSLVCLRCGDKFELDYPPNLRGNSMTAELPEQTELESNPIEYSDLIEAFSVLAELGQQVAKLQYELGRQMEVIASRAETIAYTLEQNPYPILPESMRVEDDQISPLQG